jgi:hypothetical protein
MLFIRDDGQSGIEGIGALAEFIPTDAKRDQRYLGKYNGHPQKSNIRVTLA